MEVAYSGALDCGNMREHFLSAIGRPNEPKPFCELKDLTIP
jgi:hypothetical protein